MLIFKRIWYMTNQSMFYVCSQQGDILSPPPHPFPPTPPLPPHPKKREEKKKAYILEYHADLPTRMNNQFNNGIYNISIIQNISHIAHKWNKLLVCWFTKSTLHLNFILLWSCIWNNVKFKVLQIDRVSRSYNLQVLIKRPWQVSKKELNKILNQQKMHSYFVIQIKTVH